MFWCTRIRMYWGYWQTITVHYCMFKQKLCRPLWTTPCTVLVNTACVSWLVRRSIIGLEVCWIEWLCRFVASWVMHFCIAVRSLWTREVGARDSGYSIIFRHVSEKGYNISCILSEYFLVGFVINSPLNAGTISIVSAAIRVDILPRTTFCRCGGLDLTFGWRWSNNSMLFWDFNFW